VSELDGVKISLAQCHDRSRGKDKRIAELEAGLKDIYSVTTEMQVMSIVVANLSTPPTTPLSTKEEDK
jgi:hypothetical protein